MALAEVVRRELRSARRFVLVGAANTAVTWALLAVLARFIDNRVAYTIVFALGLAFTTVATGRYVFAGTHRSWQRSALFASWYLLVYGAGLAVVDLLTRRGGLGPEIVALAAVAVTAPLSFLGGRLVFRRKPPPRSPNRGGDDND